MTRGRFLRRSAWLLSAMLGMAVACALWLGTPSDAQQPKTDSPAKAASESVRKTAPKAKIAWGKPVKGLQAGVSYVSGPFEDATDRVRVGESVSVELVIKNVSDRVIQFTTISPSFRVPNVVNAVGEELQVGAPAYDGPAAFLTEKLQPGESTKLSVHSCSVAPRYPFFNSDAYHILAGVGKYKVAAPVSLFKFKDGDWIGKLNTGAVELEVIPSDKKSLTRGMSAKLKERAKDFSCKIVYVGLAQNRLRSAGLMSQSSHEQFPSHWSTSRISEDQARAIIDYLAEEGHLWRQVAETVPMEITPMVSYYLGIEAGPGAKNSMLIQLPWPKMESTIRGLQRAVGIDRAEVLGELLKQPLFLGWHHMVAGRLLGVSVERQLYERKDDPHFYMRFLLTNRTKNDVFVDLEKHNRVFSPNQWGFHRGPQRILVDEGRMIPITLTAAKRQELIARAKDNALTHIAPGQSIDYFREFNRQGRKEVEAQQKNGKFLIVSIDGQLLATDRSIAENVNLEWTNESSNRMNTDVVIPAPVTFVPIPKRARVIEE
ncbi:MAG: hypothetical protein O3A00_24090 [Planctomycetota bacterium]|nr:hypothetical protein [Planctomycetota bacterium]